MEPARLGEGGVPKGTAVEKKDLGIQHRDGKTVDSGDGTQAVDTTPTLGPIEVTSPGMAGTPDGSLERTVQTAGVSH